VKRPAAHYDVTIDFRI